MAQIVAVAWLPCGTWLFTLTAAHAIHSTLRCSHVECRNVRCACYTVSSLWRAHSNHNRPFVAPQRELFIMFGLVPVAFVGLLLVVVVAVVGVVGVAVVLLLLL